ncbi:GATA transcription factor 5-like [Telopea speciosissima]|uniref:GATA transcription factor 5-like n=1 Tax=Telopea speciosissima TaxID=54955 RepID=UPI001CC48056|nr:GATA transcription factor 5-like [Telopea speciosissima]
MLYQTLPLFFPLNPSTAPPSSFSSSFVSVTAASPLLSHLFSFSPSSSQPQTKPEMDSVEARALKGSFQPECMAFLKASQQPFLDDVWVANGQTGVPGDDLFVDDLLDFSNNDVEEGPALDQEEEKRCTSISSHGEQPVQDISNATSFSISELSVPEDDLADLEWLSHFVEDSFSEFSVAYPSSSSPKEKTLNGNENRSKTETVTATVKPPCFPAPVPCKARSKRSRTGGRVWSLGSLSFAESSCTSSSSISSTTTSSSSSSTSPFVFIESGHNIDMFYYLGKPPAKKHKKKKKKFGADASGRGDGSRKQEEEEEGRRCSHCHVQKTPQWRTGPLGPKTLCNACGVRYKSGRLLPEYRPACSPTFSSDVHSNNHRKVLEMRQKKEIDSSESGLTPVLQSF